MGRSFFKNHLATQAVKKKGAPQPEDKAQPIPAGQADATGHGSDSTDGSEETRPAEIFDDATVCRLLRIRRKVLADARTEKTRGVDWDFVGLHAGMTRAWVDRYALDHGLVPQYTSVSAKPVQANDCVVTVKLIGTHPNPCIVMVEVLATGERRFARVKDMRSHPIHLSEQFDCIVVEGVLEWSSVCNNGLRY